MGTIDGLNRYDGYKFTTYRNDPQDTTSINNNIIWAIHEDKNGSLWIGTEGGLSLYNREAGTFNTFIYETNPNTPVQGSKFATSVLSIHEGDDGNLWLGTVFQGVTKFDPVTKQFYHFLPDSGASGNDVLWVIGDLNDKNKLWFGLNKGFDSFDIVTQTFSIPAGQEEIFKNGQTWSMFQDGKGKIWIGRQHEGLFRFDPETEKYTNFKHDPTNPESISKGGGLSLFLKALMKKGFCGLARKVD